VLCTKTHDRVETDQVKGTWPWYMLHTINMVNHISDETTLQDNLKKHYARCHTLEIKMKSLSIYAGGTTSSCPLKV
jgi:hypothetical protein